MTKRCAALIGIGMIALGAGAGCQGEIGMTEEDARIERFLSAAGYEGMNVREEKIVLDADMFVTRGQILQLITEAEARGARWDVPDRPADDLVEKGYVAWSSQFGAGPDARNLAFVFDANVPEWLRIMVRQAGIEWQGPCVRFNPTNATTNDVRVSYYPIAGGWAGRGNAAFANGFGYVEISSDYVEGVGQYASRGPASNASLYHTILHEVGHVIGMQHPTNGRHVLGTKTTPKTCDAKGGRCKANYPTIMDYDKEEGTLQNDDLKTARLVHGSSAGACTKAKR
jgi:hypothetical protein